MQVLDDILQQATSDIQSAEDLKSLEAYRVHYLGKKSQLSEFLKTLGQLPLEDRPKAGQRVNHVKEAIQTLIQARDTELSKTKIDQQLVSDTIDVTLPGRGMDVGSLHPVNQTMDELRRIFTGMGFTSIEGPEIEDDYHNFEALNIPELHPARAMQDTFYFPDGRLLRTHMSPVQIRAMKKMKPPIRVIAMGRVYRRDFDLTHTPMFHQMECLVVDKNITFTDLKGMMTYFLQTFFATDAAVRFRASYFPFTEPSAEVDMACLNCVGKGCRICKQTGWLEVLGCGMVHPNVLKMAGIDSRHFSGFACGVGIDRLTMLKHGISDLRSLFENDLRFLNQF